MKRIIHFVIIVCISVLIGTSCHAMVEDEFPDYATRPVLNGTLIADSVFRVHVSLTANLSDTAPIFVDNAFVIIKNIKNTIDTLTYAEEGWYCSPGTVKAGETYTCMVTIPGFKSMTAQTSVPLPTAIDSVKYTDFATIGEMGGKISSIEFRILNNINSKQFWEVQLVKDGWMSTYNPQKMVFEDKYGAIPEYIYMIAGQDSILLNEANPLAHFSNIKMREDFYKVKFYFNSSYALYNTEVTPYIQLKTTDESYYKYHKQYYLYDMAGEISLGKGTQKYPLYSNVTNGLGVFSGYSITREELIVSQ